MQTFNLVTMLGDQVSGLEPIVCGCPQEAIAYSCGILTERTKGHADMYANLAVRWMVEEGTRSPDDPATPLGRTLGTWSVEMSGGRSKLVWDGSCFGLTPLRAAATHSASGADQAT